jgi:hypothetical protein
MEKTSLKLTANSCGSWLASDEVGTSNIVGD